MNDQLESPENPTIEDSKPSPVAAPPSDPATTSGGEKLVSPLLEERTQSTFTTGARPPRSAGSKPSEAGVTPQAKRPATTRKLKRIIRTTRPPRPAQPAHSARPTQPHHAGGMGYEDEDDGFFARHRAKVIVAAVILLGGGAAYLFNGPQHASAPTRAPERFVSIQPLPPLPKPPPPPPPKVQPPPQQEKMVQETAAEEKPKEEAPKPAPPAPEALGTGVKGDGPGLAGLGSSGNGGGFGGGGGGRGGSKWGWYAGQVQARVTEALRRNSHTKTASMKILVRVWPDTTGRITRAKLDGTTGDRNLDDAIQNEVLNGLQLSEPPPPGMPMPIVMRLIAQRP